MLEAFSYHGTTLVGSGDGPPVTLPSSGGSLSYVPEGCIVVRSDSYKPWENPYDLVNRKASPGFSKTSQFITCVIACERCLCVFLPFKAQKYLKTSSMAAVIGVVGVFLVGGMALIAGHKHTFTCVFDPLTNETDLANSYTSNHICLVLLRLELNEQKPVMLALINPATYSSVDSETNSSDTTMS
ncbi:hypothetical protein C0Q70_11463 [Pomacea canaliculata]|uniref:Uncharacterized protein n=1 Tax=Pomacea canaliculata TaxID=400727 RepID=A0A2T7P627_POMCA|nr:hypothetical protein C0Q70_11463 [Pomacea canaliculata]